jgi:hypothetical protein
MLAFQQAKKINTGTVVCINARNPKTKNPATISDPSGFFDLN